MTRKRKVTFGKNWIKLEPGFLTKVRGRCEYVCIDLLLDDETYFLDRFFMGNKIPVEYPSDGEYRHPDYSHCVIYRLHFRKEDEPRAVATMNDMCDRAAVMEHGDEYLHMIDWFDNVMKDMLQKHEET